ncbi:3'(2'),5'-bisphosphate nucleotidase CysQ [Roseibium aggregatum]|uniref:3'(2'),5'-bisphosphate nucleotidase CysQ n=1 Tax=Roseibium aggregatum TaxID=187304 RepID=UPI0025ACD85F|nr:3'(2'),5'-bisphosphate nucleotidase CysQ [Roseibium aggregatum]MEC9420508.1 3'(2'),5'-bisphosphate nucleotidase CysQ [Pseudomonadota bacterium]WJS01502.1 3'(2'),5'-bisphosphate nucleotidase CysQ [Roseibium aggregatum]
MTEDQISFLNLLALRAGEEILKIYAEPFEVENKVDGSPVTKADAAAEEIILAGLAEKFPDIPVVAEEAVEAGKLPAAGARYFLVDPLDGTKEFLKKNGEFTVNIALIEDGRPVFGVVSAPALEEIYWGGEIRENGKTETRAFKGTIANGGISDVAPISVRTPPVDGISVLASRSHLSEETSALISRLSVAEQLNVGSSLKLCWVAAGRADFYPRLAPTMQWDIAAGDAVVRAAGGAVVLASTGEDFVYRVPENARKDDLRNPFFLAAGCRNLLRDVAPAA